MGHIAATTRLQVVCDVITMILTFHCAHAENCSELMTEEIVDIEHPRDDKPSSHSCTVCHKRFTTSSYLNMHSKGRIGENEYCTQCEKSFAYQNGLQKHTNIHT